MRKSECMTLPDSFAPLHSFLSSSYFVLSKGMELVYLQSAALHAGDARVKKTDTTPCFHRTFFLISSLFYSLLTTFSLPPRGRYWYV